MPVQKEGKPSKPDGYAIIPVVVGTKLLFHPILDRRYPKTAHGPYEVEVTKIDKRNVFIQGEGFGNWVADAYVNNFNFSLIGPNDFDKSFGDRLKEAAVAASKHVVVIDVMGGENYSSYRELFKDSKKEAKGHGALKQYIDREDRDYPVIVFSFSDETKAMAFYEKYKGAYGSNFTIYLGTIPSDREPKEVFRSGIMSDKQPLFTAISQRDVDNY